jgi:rare lipoprotein A (peptidoglycan hydrolase)
MPEMMKCLSVLLFFTSFLIAPHPSMAQKYMDSIPLLRDTLPLGQDTVRQTEKDSSLGVSAFSDTAVVGIASFYADKFEGRRTSNGEIFRQSKMTAAHNTLPLGHWIRVTRLDNGKHVVVRINDRMHPRNPRLVDLSKAAARKLGYIGSGLIMVSIQDLGTSPPPDR